MRRKTAVSVVSGGATTAASVKVFDSRDAAFKYAAEYADCLDSETWAECIKRAGYDIVEALNDYNDCVRGIATNDFIGVFVGRVRDE